MGQVYYIKDIKKIDSSKFGPVKIAGKTIKSAAARNYVAKLATGGKTAGQIGEKLRKAGLKGDQWGKRLSYLKVIEGRKNGGLNEKRVKANIDRVRRQRMDEETDAIGRGAFKKEYAGGREVESYGVRSAKEHGTMKNLGVSWNKTGGKTGGFASDSRSSKLPNNPAPKMPSIGTRPIGL